MAAVASTTSPQSGIAHRIASKRGDPANKRKREDTTNTARVRLCVHNVKTGQEIAVTLKEDLKTQTTTILPPSSNCIVYLKFCHKGNYKFIPMQVPFEALGTLFAFLDRDLGAHPDMPFFLMICVAVMNAIQTHLKGIARVQKKQVII